ncbi:MAG: tRNA (adenosine(37)-N6)-dimethylallyltransferase MiaA [Burkholderiales bacterium]|nr:tRNA (adenosine(37)-N6)-dimethylallyltransferase MiaA [Burkholderiales bacterium]
MAQPSGLDADGPVAMLLGPTASGKSALAMALAERLPIEIISVDSAQVYREMDVGTAKPTPAERAAVPHHLIDVIDPVDSYSAARFAADAQRLIDEIRGRGRLPLLVGGTMLYARALAEGLHELPGADPVVRARLDGQASVLGWPALHARLAAADPATAARLEPTDSQRIQRALEVLETTGRPLSDWLAQPAAPSSALRFARIALEPSDRVELHRRIAARFAAMIDAGLIEEVQGLRARGDLHPALPSMRCVGYRQVWAWLDAGAGRQARQAMIDAGIAATRQLAKRQLTWLRAMPERIVIDCLAADQPPRAYEILQRTLHL